MRKFWIGAVTIGVLLVMSALRIADLQWSRAETLKTAESRAANQAQIVSAYLSEAFAAGDAALRQLTLHNRRVGGPGAPDDEWAPSLVSARIGLTSIGAISIVDRDGVIRHSSRSDIVGQGRADQPLFATAMTGTSDELLVGTPFRAQVNTHEMLIPIARRLTRADGSIDGIVVASFIPAAARGFLRTIDVGRRGAIWVFHPSGVVLFLEPSASNPIGESAQTNPIFAAAVRKKGSGTLAAPVTDAGPVLISAFNTAALAPLIVGVSLDRDEVLGAWWHEAQISAAVFAVIVLTLATTLGVLYRQMDAKARAERALTRARELESARLRHANNRLAAALEREQGARLEAEAASALKDQFLMTVSHELRTPLTAISGWARMLVDGTISERQKEAALRTIDRNAHAQTRLVDDLLDVSRMMSGKLRLDIRSVDIGEVVQNAVDTVSPAAEAKTIRIETAIDPAAGRISGDPERLQQIVWNLLSNAVKFTPNGGRVLVTAVPVDGGIEIAVSDTGVGIAPDFLPHVFERFRQQDATTKRRFGGLGLGLAIVLNLVELHGGSVTAHSDGEGHGATFTVRLPAPAASSTGSTAGAGVSSATTQARLDGVRVLVVDDDAAARELFVTILESAGATVTPAASAAEALAALRHASYDVLLSDLEMPDVDGYALVNQATALAGTRGDRLMAIAVTAYSRPEDETRSLEAGFHRHVTKPVEPTALVVVVRSVWNTRDDTLQHIRKR